MGKNSESCPFCSVPSDAIIAENGLAFAIFDKYPVNPGHALIIPKRHFFSFFEATREEREALFDLLEEVKRILDRQFRPDGYNIGVNVGEAAGQTVMHLHIHLIPRYRGDEPDPTGGVRGVICSKKNYRKLTNSGSE
jgi:diadenosine tetraphosphate (Ap4A) HIT family hydrolase